MASYLLVTYQSEKASRAGVLVDEKVFDAATLTRKASYVTMIDILNDWKTAQGVIRKAAAMAAKSKLKSQAVARCKLLAPVLWPSAIYCAGANYTETQHIVREVVDNKADVRGQSLGNWEEFVRTQNTNYSTAYEAGIVIRAYG